MNDEEKQLHLNNIVKGTEEIIELTRGIDYNGFVRENQVREAVYTNLQMIGHAAYSLSQNADNVIGLNFPTDVLSGFRNARYNEEAEVNHQMVWGIIQNDLEIIREEAIRSSAELGVPAQ